MSAPRSARQQRDERLLQRRRAGARLRVARRPVGQRRGRHPSRPASRIARPPPYRRWRPGRSCRAAPARMRAISSQNWRRDSGSTPVVGSSRISKSGSWISAATKPELLPHAAGEFAGRPVGEGREAGRLRASPAMRRFALARVWPNSRPKKAMFSRDAEIRIEVLAQALRHVGDARADASRWRRLADVAAEHLDRPAWIARAPAMRLSSVDLPTPSGPISPTMHAGRNSERRYRRARRRCHSSERDALERAAIGFGLSS